MNSHPYFSASATTPMAINPSRRGARAARAFLVVLGLTIFLNWPGAASATPAFEFSSDVTKVSFDALNIIYGQGQGNDFLRQAAERSEDQAHRKRSRGLLRGNEHGCA